MFLTRSMRGLVVRDCQPRFWRHLNCFQSDLVKLVVVVTHFIKLKHDTPTHYVVEAVNHMLSQYDNLDMDSLDGTERQKTPISTQIWNS